MNTKTKNISVIIIIAFALLAGSIFAFTKISQAGLVVNTNVASLEAIDHLNKTQDSLSKTFKKLSDTMKGLKDEGDSEGLAVAEEMGVALANLDKLQKQNLQNIKVLSIAAPLLDQLDSIISQLQGGNNVTDALSRLQTVKKQFSGKEVKAFSKPVNLIIDPMIKDAKAYFKTKSPSKSSSREYAAKIKKSKASVSDLGKEVISYFDSSDKVTRDAIDETNAIFSDYYDVDGDAEPQPDNLIEE